MYPYTIPKPAVPQEEPRSRFDGLAALIRRGRVSLTQGRVEVPTRTANHRGDVGTMILPLYRPDALPAQSRYDGIYPITLQGGMRVRHPWE